MPLRTRSRTRPIVCAFTWASDILRTAAKNVYLPDRFRVRVESKVRALAGAPRVDAAVRIVADNLRSLHEAIAGRDQVRRFLCRDELGDEQDERVAVQDLEVHFRTKPTQQPAWRLARTLPGYPVPRGRQRRLQGPHIPRRLRERGAGARLRGERPSRIPEGRLDVRRRHLCLRLRCYDQRCTRAHHAAVAKFVSDDGEGRAALAEQAVLVEPCLVLLVTNDLR